MSDSEELQHEHSHHGEEHEAPSRETLFRQLGERLRNARQHRDISLDEAVHALKLRKVYVEALEDGDWSGLPGEVYAIGFLRQYASYLDLSLDDDIRKLKSDAYELTQPETFPDPPIAPKKSWVIVAALGLMVLIVIFNIFNNGGDTPAPTPAIEPPAQSTPAPQPAIEAPVPETSPAEETPPAPAADEGAPAAAEAVAPHVYRFEAVGDDVWLQLHSTGDSPELLREALLHAGETLTVTSPDTVLSLTCGNPPALAVYIDDKLAIAAGHLGSERGKVIRDYRLHVGDHE